LSGKAYNMISTAKSMRLQIAFFGRTNTGKSSLINFITGQDISITSPVAGTTTDIVEKAMEFAPVGPVVFSDTAGLDDSSELGLQRIRRTWKAFERADIAVLVTTPGIWGEVEESVVQRAAEGKNKLIIIVNKCDLSESGQAAAEKLRAYSSSIICCDCSRPERRRQLIDDFRSELLKNLPADYLEPPPLTGDMLQPGDLAVMVVPIDLQAPKGRLILPQVQTIRDNLDRNAMTLVMKEDQYKEHIAGITPQPKLIICDSQVVKMVVEHAPAGVPCTTFSILFSRLKGDVKTFLDGCSKIPELQDNDRVLIAEACTHHPTCEDIGRVKLPRLLKKATGKDLQFDFAPGRDFPEDISSYKLIVHCGSCMLNRQETLYRISCARKNNIAITNYGMAISYCQGVLDKVTII